MSSSTRRALACSMLSSCVFVCLGHAQIVENGGDDVLNAPYCGTIDSLREGTFDVGYGEVRSFVEPVGSATIETGYPIRVWHDPLEGDPWDRSVLRLFNGLDASGTEIDLTDHASFEDALELTYESFKRLSLKAIATKSLATQKYVVCFSYKYQGSFRPRIPRTFRVAPTTGSFCALPGLREAYHYGTPVLDVSAGGARLVVPIGQTADMVGAAFLDRIHTLGPSVIDAYDVVLPGAAESVQIQDQNQFALLVTGYGKSAWGTPWPGYLPGFFCRDDAVSPAEEQSDLFGPDGTHYDSPDSPTTQGPRHFSMIRPARLSTSHAATVVRTYDSASAFYKRVTQIRDQATPANWISIDRTPLDHLLITTSDGRSWQLLFDADRRITGVVPGSGKGAVYFSWSDTLQDNGRVTEVRRSPAPGEQVLYRYEYYDDAEHDGDLKEEWAYLDGAMRKRVEHVIVSDTERRRVEWYGPGAGDFRRTDLAYDAVPNLRHRLAGITVYEDPDPGPETTAYTTTYTHDVDNPAGSMVITRTDLPDGTYVAYEYDSHIAGDDVQFGFRTKATRIGPTDGSLITFDADYEFFYMAGSTKRLFYQPRVVHQRDGRGSSSEVTYDYENGDQDQNGDGLKGEVINQLLKITGPVITEGHSGTRAPETRFLYDPAGRILTRREVVFDSGLQRATDFIHDSLRRRTSTVMDPGGEDLTTRFLYCDASPTQDRITVDPDGYWTRTRFDNDGRVAEVEQFLDPNAGSLAAPCADPAGPVYRAVNTYDSRGYLAARTVDNKDQAGASLVPEAIVTTFTRDRLGRLTQRTLDMDGTDQEWHVDHNWLGEIEKEYDTSGRGTAYTYDGRGLPATQTPLALNQTPDTNLTTSFDYDEMGRQTFTWPPTHPAGPHFEREYDNFGRLKHTRRHPGADGGNLVTTTYEYDPANNVTRTYVAEAGVGVLSDATARYDEGGFNYESRQRTVPGADNAADPVTQRKFDWAGNVIAEAGLGDDTVADLVVQTVFDLASRVEFVRGYANTTLLSETWFAQRDGRGNVTQQQDRLDGSTWAVSDVQYDALGRAVRITDPPDHAGLRHYRQMEYDSRGNLLRASACAQDGTPALTTVFAYDNAGRNTRAAVLADPASAARADQADPAVDRVADTEYDADGRPRYRKTYNNNVATPLTTETLYDALGRVYRVTDPLGNYAATEYAPNGRFHERTIHDGVGLRALVADSYDGHDRAIILKAEGPPDLFTTLTYDGLDRTIVTGDPNGVYRAVAYDLVGRPTNVYEDWSGPLQRETCLTYNRLGQLVLRIAENRASNGAALPEQVTTYRHDPLGRTTRVVYPDAPPGQHANPGACSDCVRLAYDYAGRPLQRQDQRNTTDFAFDARGQLHARTTGAARDTYYYDALGRIRQAARGTTTDEEAVAGSQRSYTGLGDLDCEVQTIRKGTPRTTDYDYDQAGNQTLLGYPDGEALTYTPTALNQVDSILRAGNPLVQYGYQGRQLHTRTTTTDAPGEATTYRQTWGYDAHRRIDGLTNTRDAGAGPETVADYLFTHDLAGNPLSRIVVTGLPDFAGDDRGFQVDRLNRLVGTAYYGSGEAEATTFDRLGNREAHVNRQGETTQYTLANPANEYAAINGQAVQYDGTGNLSRDEDGRGYAYDEQNRLVRVFEDTNGNGVHDAGETVLANYAYDAFGRRVEFENLGASTTTRYYYAAGPGSAGNGVSVIQERDAADNLVRSHVHGTQYLDERVTTFEATGLRAGQTSYYLLGGNFSVVGVGSADGSEVTRLEYSPAGDPVGPGGGLFFDADDDGDLDLADWVSLAACLGGPAAAAGSGCVVHDFTRDGAVDLADAAAFQRYFSGEGNPASVACRRAGSYAHDADGDRDVDIDDYLSYESCLATPPREALAAVCLAIHDFDGARRSDGDVDLDDFGGLLNCFSGAGQTPPPECFRPAPEGVPPGSGSFALHGGMVDVLTSGRSGPEAALSLQYSRARYFDLKHGRFLQRDPKGYVDGGNLYEAFGSNPARFTDPMGTFYEPWSGGPEELLVEQLFEDPEVLLVVGQGTVGVGEAIVELPVEVVVGVYTAIRHPIRTASGIGQAASTTYNNARACGDCRVVAVLQTVGAGAASVAGMGGILNAIEEPGTIREKTKEFTKGTMQLVLVAVPASKAAMAGKAGTVATTLDDIGRAGVNSLDDIGRAGVNVVDDAVRTGMGTVDDAARAAGTAPAGAVPPAMGEQLLFDFVRQDAASVAARGTRAVGSTRHIHLNPADNGAYMVLLEDGTAYIGKGGTARARQSARRASRQQNSPVDDIAHWATPDDASAFAKEAELIKSVGGKDASGLLNIINSPGKR